MNLAIPNATAFQFGAAVVQVNPSQNVIVKASPLTGDVLETRSVQPVEKSEVLQKDSVESLQKYVLQNLELTPSEILEKGSAFLSDPNWPPLTAVNAISTIFIHDFFLNKVNQQN